MAEETEGDGYTLGLLVDLRDVCRKISDNHYRMAAELKTRPDSVESRSGTLAPFFQQQPGDIV